MMGIAVETVKVFSTKDRRKKTDLSKRAVFDFFEVGYGLATPKIKEKSNTFTVSVARPILRVLQKLLARIEKDIEHYHQGLEAADKAGDGGADQGAALAEKLAALKPGRVQSASSIAPFGGS